MYKIISLDGGGIKGLVELAILNNIMEDFPKLIEDADVVSGASTGGIIALCLASGMSIETTMDMYIKNSKRTIKTTLCRSYRPT